jgi:hypothetical protein
MRLSKYLLLSFVLITLPDYAHSGWKDWVSEIKQSVKKEQKNTASSSLSEEMIVAGLKQALNQGIEKSVKLLGKQGGFLNDASVKIPMPKTLKKIEKGLRKAGQDKVADKFIRTMNHAAEQSMSKTTNILIQAVKSMTLTDAINILNGEDDAATQYFKRSSASHLQGAIEPIVKNATDTVGVTESYKKMINEAGFLAKYVDQDSLDIDRYITNKAIDGLFIKIALEEKRIREEPVARTTDLLREVFGR